MRNYAAEMNQIVAEYSAAARSVQQQFFDADARTTRAGTEFVDELRRQMSPRDSASDEHRSEPAQTEAEQAQLFREVAERRDARERAQRRDGETYVLPSDWTDADQARAEGYGPPDSWLR